MTWSERIQRELTEADIGAAKVRALRKASEEGRRCTAEDVQVEMAAIAGGGGGGAEANGTLSGLGGSGLGTRGSRSSTAATGSRRFAHVGDDGGDDGRGVGVWGGGAPRSDDHSVEPVELDSYTPLIGANPPREGSRSNHYPRKNKRVQDLLPQVQDSNPSQTKRHHPK